MTTDPIETVVVAGASGQTGRQLLRILDGRATVRALTRSPEAAERLRRAGADEVVVDNLLDPTDLVGAVGDADAVVSAVGSDIGDIRRAGEYVDGAGTIALLDAAVDAGADSFVMESALGVGEEPASPLATAFDVFIRPIQRAKAEAEAAIRDRPIRHTILRPGVLTNGPRTDGPTVADPGAKLWGTVSRADVARLMAAAPVTEAAADRTLEVVSSPSFPRRGVDIEWHLPAPKSEDIEIQTADS